MEEGEGAACDGEFAAVGGPEGVQVWDAGSGWVGDEGCAKGGEELIQRYQYGMKK